MGKCTEKDIAEFALDLINRLCEIDEDYVDASSEWWILRWGNVAIPFLDIRDSEWTVEDLLEISAEAKAHPENEEPDVREFTGDKHCIAYLSIEGDLYETMYYYEGYGEGGERAKKYLNALQTAVHNHNMWFSWADGAIKLYDIDDDGNDDDEGVVT